MPYPKVACYCMTRNIYHKVEPSLNSLLRNTPDIERVYLLTEDNDIGFEVPGKVRIKNVRKQTFFSPDGPNYYCQWTYMCMMKTALAKLFPQYDRMLTLDLDTIVLGNISEVWETPMGDNYLAGVLEPKNTADGLTYINGGVVLWNLKQLRDGMVDKIIDSLNTEPWTFPEQNCVSHLCNGRIYCLHPMYNTSNYSAPCKNPKIRHFAATPGWYERDPLVQMYKERV